MKHKLVWPLSLLNPYKMDAIFLNLMATLLLIVVVLLIRSAINRAIARSKRSYESRVELKAHTRSLSHVILLFGVMIVWGSELRTFALSLVAMAAAIAVAMKELITCFLGGVLKSFSRPFKVGDRIEMGNGKGEVIGHDFLTTTILEVHPITQDITGRRIILPNSLLLTSSVALLSKRPRYQLHSFTVTVPWSEDVAKHHSDLLAAAQEICAESSIKAQIFLRPYSEYLQQDVNTLAEPRVHISCQQANQITLNVRIAAPAAHIIKIEQNILLRYFAKRGHKQATYEKAVMPGSFAAPASDASKSFLS
jgi:small-conductance mechanosensitive channel